MSHLETVNDASSAHAVMFGSIHVGSKSLNCGAEVAHILVKPLYLQPALQAHSCFYRPQTPKYPLGMFSQYKLRFQLFW